MPQPPTTETFNALLYMGVFMEMSEAIFIHRAMHMCTELMDDQKGLIYGFIEETLRDKMLK